MVSEHQCETFFADTGDVLKVIQEETRAIQFRRPQKIIPGLCEHVSEERASRAEKQARGFTFKGNAAEIDPLESPISKLGAQPSMHLWRRKQNVRELAEKDLGQSQVVGDVGGNRNENGLHRERRLRAESS